MTTPPVILVTGSNGQLGSELRELAPANPQYKFVFFSRTELSIENREEVERAFALLHPQYVINCAAYTAVDKAETGKEQAMAVNATAVALLAGASRKYNAKFIHVSTDYVFDGTSREPLKEDAPVSPVNFYGASKLKGEEEAQKENPDSIIIRTSWVYSFYGKNFVKTMLRLMADRDSVGVVADQFGSPTYAADLADVILQIIRSSKWLPGIYHFSNEGVITWAEFADEIRELSSSKCTVQYISTEQYPTPARRPAYSVMDKNKIVSTYGIALKPWRESLRACLQKLKKGSVET
ncbi:MAG TPA: dTDP-4-dehydrorhamnose reductase [Flavisolibacter sp.]|jgi:dTDP-4-dehydrorhamnose reductase|nr:dTDP-4-dehydrorhamnose reductase [Flavisolibacter sp.]